MPFLLRCAEQAHLKLAFAPVNPLTLLRDRSQAGTRNGFWRQSGEVDVLARNITWTMSRNAVRTACRYAKRGELATSRLPRNAQNEEAFTIKRNREDYKAVILNLFQVTKV